METVTANNIDEVKAKRGNAKPKKNKITVSPIHHQLFKMLRNNTSLRFHTAKHIRAMHGFKNDDTSAYVIFLLDRYTVKVNGMEHQYPYSSEIFIQAYVAAQLDVNEELETAINNFVQDTKGCSVDDFIDSLNNQAPSESTE